MRQTWLTKMAGALAVLVLVGTSACVTRDDSGDDNSGNTGNTGGNTGGTTDGGGTTGGNTGGNTGGTTTTVQAAYAGYTKGQAISIANAVVVAEHHYVSNGATVGTFYIQDQDKAGPGIAVYHSKSDTAAYPAIGDVVSVSGWMSRYNGSIQISSSTKYSTTLAVTVTGAGQGHAVGGAMPPAGTPISASGAADYAASITDNHPDQVGQVLQFAGPLSITNNKAVVTTNADGGTTTAGFEVTGGLRVYDNQVYYDCMKSLDGGTLDLSHGIRGVWDRYQDFNAGTSQNPAPKQPVLVPMNCNDLNPQ